MDRCQECGFVYADVAREEIPSALRALVGSYSDRLTESDEEVLRAHFVPGVWSALEYACHMRNGTSSQSSRRPRARAQVTRRRRHR